MAGHTDMLVLVDADVHPVPLDTDASTEGSPWSLLLLEGRASNLHLSSEEQRGLESQALNFLPVTVLSEAVVHLAIASPYRLSSFRVHLYSAMAFDGVDSARDTRCWYRWWSYCR